MHVNPPPQALEIEEGLISSCLNGDAKKVVQYLKHEDFYKSAHQIIFNVVSDMCEKGQEVDILTVAHKIKEVGLIEDIGGVSFLSEFSNTIPPSTNIKHYAEIVRDKAKLRVLINKSNKIIESCYNANGDTTSVIDQAQQSIINIETKTNNADSYKNLVTLAGDRYEKLRKRERPSGIPSGFPDIDYYLTGFQNSDLVFIGARPGMGKTSLMLNLIKKPSVMGIGSLIFSLEMSKTQILDRSVAIESGVDSVKFRTGAFDQENWKQINDAQSKIYDWPVYIDDSGGLHYMEIKRRARWYVKNKGVKIIFIDHLQLVRTDKGFSRDREISSIVDGFKELAKELNVPVIVLSQLNRGLESRNNPHKRPKISDLRDSGTIEQNADVVMFLYRRAVYDDWYYFPYSKTQVYNDDGSIAHIEREAEFQADSEIEIAKHRNGPTGHVKLIWHDKTTAFRSVAR